MRILIYTRLWNKEFYTELANDISLEAEIVYFSDFKNVGDVWAGDFIYKKDYDYPCLNVEEENNIITRCRFLRSIKDEKARELCRRMYNGLEELVIDKNIDLVLMPIVDCYTLDIIARVCEKRGIKLISFVQNFIKGYSRFSVRGERINLNREVSTEEIDKVYAMLVDNNYKPAFSLNKKVSRKGVLKRYIWNFCKEKIYYSYKKVFNKDKYNYHYNTVGNVTLREAMSSFSDEAFTHLSDLETFDRERAIYVPLHFTPEATVDYWSYNSADCFYEQRILEIINKSDPEITFILKEHPAMMGRRGKTFYDDLNSKKNVILIHPYDSSNELLDLVDNVMVHTGSVGVEALLRNKRLITLTPNYYSDIHPNIHLAEEISFEDLSKPLIEYEGKQFISDLLQGLFQYRYVAGWQVSEKSDDISTLAYWCRELIEMADDKNALG